MKNQVDCVMATFIKDGSGIIKHDKMPCCTEQIPLESFLYDFIELLYSSNILLPNRLGPQNTPTASLQRTKTLTSVVHSAGAVEGTDCFSVEG